LIKPAKPWVFRSQVGGFRTIYEGGLSFVTSIFIWKIKEINIFL